MKKKSTRKTIPRLPHPTDCLDASDNCSRWASRLRHVPSGGVLCDVHAVAGAVKRLHWAYRDLEVFDINHVSIPLSQAFGEAMDICRGCERPIGRRREDMDSLHPTCSPESLGQADFPQG